MFESGQPPSNQAAASAPKFIVKTMGCKANLVDSQWIAGELVRRGWKPADGAGAADGDAQLCIVNSCTVTDEADRQSRKMASRLSRDYPRAKIVFTGCSAEVDPETGLEGRGIHYVVGNRDKPKLVDLVLGRIAQPMGSSIPTDASGRPNAPELLGVTSGYSEILSRHPMDREWPSVEQEKPLTPESLNGGETGVGSGSDRTRAFIKIQDGCNSFCTYCIIPYGRGPSRSLKIPEVVEQINRLVSQGYREVVITGINIGDYGMDWSDRPLAPNAPVSGELENLFETIFRQTKLERLRVSSLDPTEITPRLMGLMRTEPRFVPHFHVSLQSAHSRVLRLMKRKYSFEHVEACLQSIAALGHEIEKRDGVPGGVFVGMDVITGFPGETLEEFEWTRDQLALLPWTRLHVFPYSERAGTPATRLPDAVPPAERKRRCAELRELSLARMKSKMEAVLAGAGGAGANNGRAPAIPNVLLESTARGPDGTRKWMSGYSPGYLRFLVPANSDWTNQLVTLSPESVWVDSDSGDVTLIGQPVGPCPAVI